MEPTVAQVSLIQGNALGFNGNGQKQKKGRQPGLLKVTEFFVVLYGDGSGRPRVESIGKVTKGQECKGRGPDSGEGNAWGWQWGQKGSSSYFFFLHIQVKTFCQPFKPLI